MNSGGNMTEKAKSLVLSLVPAVMPVLIQYVVPAITDLISRKPIVIPDLGSEQFPLSVNQVIERLHNSRLNATPIKMSMNEADPKYRNCFNGQVIASRPKAGARASVGQEISVKYITREVIDESQRLYEQKLKKGKEKPLPPGDEAAER